MTRARHDRGAATVYFLLFTVLFFGFMAMATDFGRMYVIQAELQAAADAAALSAANQLLGTASALTLAADQVTTAFDTTTNNDNRFNFRLNTVGGTGLVSETNVDYYATLLDARANTGGGQAGGIDWGTGLYPKYVRVQIAAQAPLLFFPMLTRNVGALPTVVVSSVAGLSAPVCSACGIDGLAIIDPSVGEDTVHFGLIPGAFYTLYLTASQQTPNVPATPAALAGTEGVIEYAILNHIPSGPEGLALDSVLFQLGAGGLSTATGLDPVRTITVDSVEAPYPDLVGNIGTGTTSGRNILCGLNARFGVDPSENTCGGINGGEFVALASLFAADTDVGADEYAAGAGLQDFATEYAGNHRRVLTMAVVDTIDSLTVLNFRQFLLETSPTVGVGVDDTVVSGAFRAQYIGTPVPLRCGGVGGACRVTLGVGRTVLH